MYCAYMSSHKAALPRYSFTEEPAAWPQELGQWGSYS